jgi:hypothetical protein
MTGVWWQSSDIILRTDFQSNLRQIAIIVPMNQRIIVNQLDEDHRGIRTKLIGTPEGITMQSAFGSLFSRPQFGMAVCISSQVHTDLMSWSISQSGMTAESTVWKLSRVSLISQPRLHVVARLLRVSSGNGILSVS